MEKNAIEDYNSDSDASKKDLSKKINMIREQYEEDKEDMLDDKIKDAKKIDRKYKRIMLEFAEDYETHAYIQVVKDSGNIWYEAVLRK